MGEGLGEVEGGRPMNEAKATKKKTAKTKASKPPRPIPNNVEAMMSRADVADALRVSVRHLDGMIATDEYPQPDTHLGRAPRWDRETHNRWVRQRCNREA